MDCLFCKIVEGIIPANLIYGDENVIAFDDIHPQAPCHKVIIPRKHIATLNDTFADDQLLLGHLLQTGVHLAKSLNLADAGYRFIMNCNADGGQTIFHIHLHLLGGRHMTWPPG